MKLFVDKAPNKYEKPPVFPSPITHALAPSDAGFFLHQTHLQQLP